MTDLQFTPEATEEERTPRMAATLRGRRLGRTPRRRAVRRAPSGTIAEGIPQQDVNVREGLYRRTLAGADGVCAMAALLVVVVWGAGAPLDPWIPLSAPIAVFANKIGGLYERDELVLKKTTLDEAPALLQLSGLFALIVFLVQNQLVHAALTPDIVFALWMTTFVALLLGRMAARHVAGRLSRPERCLVMGAEAAIRSVRGKLRAAEVNAEVVATAQLDPAAPPLDGSQFLELVREHEVHRVIVAPVTTDARDTMDLIRVAKSAGVRVSVLPRLFEVVGSSVEFDQLDGLTMLGVRRFGLTRSSYALKRAFDIAGSMAGLLLVAPVIALAALAVRLDSKGPVLFRQTRVGRDGEPFEIFKFRTMVPEAETLKAGLAHLNELEGGMFKIAEDPRITRVGRFLRRTALDELPQLVNVWRGDMSLVGPRPLVADEDAKIEGLDRSRLQLTPGMTGDWQILGSGRIPLHEMVGIDYLYVANWSLWTDLKILLRTVPYMLARRGA